MSDDKTIISSRNKQTLDDLKRLQEMDLDEKVRLTRTRILEWYTKNDNKCYVSFSGGKDSTVLADISAQVCKILECKLTLWFSNTGLEYPELIVHTKSYKEYLEKKYDIEVELVMDYPKDKDGNRITFRDVVLNEGYPLISKHVAQRIWGARRGQTSAIALLNGTYTTNGKDKSIFNCEKWKFLLDAPFKISHKCCYIMKKNPAHQFNKSSGMVPIIGTMACESRQRQTAWLKNGCNAFNSKNKSSQPMSFWFEQDVLKYLKDNKIPYASVYGDIVIDGNGNYKTTGCDRTGCIFCGFGCHLDKGEENRFQRLKRTHPKIYEYCMKSVSDGGLGMKTVLDFIGVKSE